ncbi:MAG: L,D-transpeptidase family protein [Acidobacteria bacterium]|nr:L,D-transpeptidase family protein [Acidobacteriota bacterium]
MITFPSALVFTALLLAAVTAAATPPPDPKASGKAAAPPAGKPAVPAKPAPPAAHQALDRAAAAALLARFEADNPGCPPLAESRQLLLAVNLQPECPWARFFTFERPAPGQPWKIVTGPLDVHVGKRGFAPFGKKVAGDRKTPSGLFPLGTAFGYAPSAVTKLDYRPATARDCWVDDPRSPDYNRWVSKPPPAGVSHEKMRRADDLYRLGLVIRYNEDPIVPGKGSAIFLHIRRTDRVGTAGCVAMLPAEVAALLAWLDQAACPVILMGSRAELETLRLPRAPASGKAGQ